MKYKPGWTADPALGVVLLFTIFFAVLVWDAGRDSERARAEQYSFEAARVGHKTVTLDRCDWSGQRWLCHLSETHSGSPLLYSCQGRVVRTCRQLSTP